MLLSLLLAWALVTGASAVALVAFLAFDEWQVRRRLVEVAAGPDHGNGRAAVQEATPQAA